MNFFGRFQDNFVGFTERFGRKINCSVATLVGADVTDGCQLNSGQRESAIVIIIWNVEAAVACSFVCQSDFARN